VVHRDFRFNEMKAMRASLERELEIHEDEEYLYSNIEEPQIDVENPHAKDPGVETSSQTESSRAEESALERLTDCCMMHGRMWEHPHLSVGRGSHLRGTLDT